MSLLYLRDLFDESEVVEVVHIRKHIVTTIEERDELVVTNDKEEVQPISYMSPDFVIEHVDHIDFLGVDKYVYVGESILLNLWNNLRFKERFVRTGMFLAFQLEMTSYFLSSKYLFSWSGRYQVQPRRSKIKPYSNGIIDWRMHGICKDLRTNPF